MSRPYPLSTRASRGPGPVKRLARAALLLWAVGTIAGAGWALSQNPLARPFVERSATELRAALTRAIADQATPEWLAGRLRSAIEAQDGDDAKLLLSVATENAVPLPDDLRAEAAALVAKDEGWLATTGDCAICMVDFSRCPNLAMLGACAIPFQLSPAGDAAALGQQGWNWFNNKPVDGLDAALAGLGLAATVVAIPTLGASVPAKLGLGALRVARKADALSPGLTRALRSAATEAGGAKRLEGMAADATRIAAATSPAEALGVLRLADDGDDLARLARFSEAAGPETRKALAVLGKGRSLRLAHRLSDAALAAFGFVMALIAQLGAVLGAGLKLALRRAAR